MRQRKDIEENYSPDSNSDWRAVEGTGLLLEVLLDIRALLATIAKKK